MIIFLKKIYIFLIYASQRANPPRPATNPSGLRIMRGKSEGQRAKLVSMPHAFW